MSFHKVKNKVLNSIDIDVNRIINDHMNKMKEIIKEGWDVFPPWLLVGHGLLIAVSFLIILFV